MRKHILPLTATLAAALMIAGASAASASARTAPSTGPTIGTISQAGYQASGRNFRFAETVLTVPDMKYLTGFYPTEYLELSNGTQLSTRPIPGSGDEYARVGIEACVVANSQNDPRLCSNGGWTAFVDTYNNSLNAPITRHYFPITVSAGDGVQVSVYFDAQGGELHFVINPPNSTGNVPSYTPKTSAHGAIFDHASALDDWTNSTGTPVQLPPFVQAFPVNQFLGGAFTTGNGQRGSFAGPWETSAVEATSNGLAFPSGTPRVTAGVLSTDGYVANGAARTSDLFTIYAG